MKSRAGLSLVEVMIALGLLTTVIAALMSSLGSAAAVNTTADLRERAVTASQRLIEQIQAANSLYTVYQTYSASTFDVPGLSPPSGRARVGRTCIPSYYAVSAPTTTPGPMPVLIEIRWKTGNSANDVFAISYIAVPR
jgi:type II secretory pathway pseudopilin PulG